MRQILRLSPVEGPPGGPPGAEGGRELSRAPSDALEFLIETRDPASGEVERLVARTTTASLGFVAYYAAAREYADRRITLRRGASVLATWNGSPRPHNS